MILVTESKLFRIDLITILLLYCHLVMFAHIPYGERFLDWHLKAALIILTLNELYTIYIQHSAYSVELNANVSES